MPGDRAEGHKLMKGELPIMKSFFKALLQSLHCVYCSNSSDVRNAMRYC